MSAQDREKFIVVWRESTGVRGLRGVDQDHLATFTTEDVAEHVSAVHFPGGALEPNTRYAVHVQDAADDFGLQVDL